MSIRYPLLVLGILALLFAIWAGLLRMGWAWPTPQPDLAAAHGPLMVSAFLGTVISLERAVAFDKRPAYLVPLLSALGGIVLILGVSWVWAARLLVLSSVGLCVMFFLIVRHHAAVYTISMALGAVAWLGGNLLLELGRPIYAIVPWWVVFLVLTIAGERLELSRVLRPTRRIIILFAVAVAVFLGGVVLSAFQYDSGVRVVGLGMVFLAIWLLLFDIARRNLRHHVGLTRFIAFCLFTGYFWLAAGGLLWIIYGGVMAGPIYDAILHSVFLGFVFAMIFGHAPLIFPSVLRRPMAYLPAFYLPLILLHITLFIRVVGDLTNNMPLRQWSGLLNGLTLLLFLGTIVAALIKGRNQRPGVA